MSDTEQGPMLAVYRSLPPGLELPSPDDPTDHFLKEKFNHDNHEYAAIEQFGAFVVARAVWSAHKTHRVSFMPTQVDFKTAFADGYGLNLKRLQDPYGGLFKLRRAQGFYPKDYEPSADELKERFRWMAESALRPNIDYEPPDMSIREVMEWGRARHLLPARKIIYRILGNTDEIRHLFALEKPLYQREHNFFDVYQFAAQVLRDHGRPLTQEEMDESHSDRFTGSPSELIRSFFGGTNRLWLEFDLAPSSHGLSQQEIINLGVQDAIRTNNPHFTAERVRQLSRQKRLPQAVILEKMGITVYRQKVEEGYNRYQQTLERFEDQGVSRDAMQVVCQKFEATPEYEEWLQHHLSVLQRLSNVGARATFLRERIQHGLELDSRAVYTWRLSEIHKVLNAWKLDDNQKRFVFDLIPRINTDEAMDAGPPSTSADAAYSIHPRPWSRSIRTGSEL